MLAVTLVKVAVIVMELPVAALARSTALFVVKLGSVDAGVVDAGCAREAPGASTVTTVTIPSSSSQVTPSATGRRRSA